VSCDAVQERLSELALGRALEAPERWDAELREHALGCGACAAHVRFLHALVDSLEASPAVPLHGAVVAGARARAGRALRAQAPAPRFARELVVALAVGVLALPLLLGDAWLVGREASALLSPWLPRALLTWLGVVYFGSLALTTGALYAAIPLAIGLTRRERA
jgi:anti-sigma factor RsiW